MIRPSITHSRECLEALAAGAVRAVITLTCGLHEHFCCAPKTEHEVAVGRPLFPSTKCRKPARLMVLADLEMAADIESQTG